MIILGKERTPVWGDDTEAEEAVGGRDGTSRKGAGKTERAVGTHTVKYMVHMHEGVMMEFIILYTN